jgi:hypothetical protein
VDAYKAWKKNRRNQFKQEQGRVKKQSIHRAFDLIVVFIEEDMYGRMVRAALATATVSSGRSMLAHQ